MLPAGTSEGRERASGLREDVSVWSLWVLSSALGGAVGGAAFVLEFLGVLILFGLIFGAAQALVLRRYIRRATGFWVVASFFGWLTGWLILGVAQGALEGLLSEITRRTGSEAVATQSLQILVWVVLGVFQALVLGRWSSPFLASLWALAGLVGGTAAQVVAFYLANAPALQPGGGRGLPEQVLSGVASQAAAGALYGAATGVVLVMIARRSATQEEPA